MQNNKRNYVSPKINQLSAIAKVKIPIDHSINWEEMLKKQLKENLQDQLPPFSEKYEPKSNETSVTNVPISELQYEIASINESLQTAMRENAGTARAIADIRDQLAVLTENVQAILRYQKAIMNILQAPYASGVSSHQGDVSNRGETGTKSADSLLLPYSDRFRMYSSLGRNKRIYVFYTL
ncbi:uncharacterized protein LOC126264705 isoform X2 [Aethina tumida]|uniref:uncharacterized protein LOC126264705 isoform X2 n=1 Tax=Aethina tumida TaxID=116153 RepID=UPI002147CE2D|nr:uncharacterized protein LOC126264705 isoform X2 [Aethina tumida]